MQLQSVIKNDVIRKLTAPTTAQARGLNTRFWTKIFRTTGTSINKLFFVVFIYSFHAMKMRQHLEQACYAEIYTHMVRLSVTTGDPLPCKALRLFHVPPELTFNNSTWCSHCVQVLSKDLHLVHH